MTFSSGAKSVGGLQSNWLSGGAMSTSRGHIGCMQSRHCNYNGCASLWPFHTNSNRHRSVRVCTQPQITEKLAKALILASFVGYLKWWLQCSPMFQRCGTNSNRKGCDWLVTNFSYHRTGALSECSFLAARHRFLRLPALSSSRL